MKAQRLRVLFRAFGIAAVLAACGDGPTPPADIPSEAEFRGVRVTARVDPTGEEGVVRVVAEGTNVSSVFRKAEVANDGCGVIIGVYDDDGRKVLDERRDLLGGVCSSAGYELELAPAETEEFPDQRDFDLPAALGHRLRGGTYYLTAEVGMAFDTVEAGQFKLVSGNVTVLAGSVRIR